MTKINKTKFVAVSALVAVLASATALANKETWNISLGIIDDGHGGDGSPYSWYHEGIRLDWTAPVGQLNIPSPPVSAPYEVFYLTAVTTKGHCFEMAVKPTSNLATGLGVYALDHGVVKMVNFPAPNAYSKNRVWIKRASGGPTVSAGLYFATPYQVPPPAGAAIDLIIRRFEYDSKATCTAGGLPWVSWEGTATDYTFSKGNF